MTVVSGKPPTKHNTLNQCRFNVVPPSATLAQQYTTIVLVPNIKPPLFQCVVSSTPVDLH